ncbi:MAG: AI-2E family transporter [Deltaproteobacteria bacterium]|nr:AI-2E family transporter [Deltaproteobacteria bacterium]
MTPLFQSQKRAFLVLLISLLVLVFYILRPFFLVFLISLVFVLLFYPIYEFFLRKFRGKAYLASFFSTLIMTWVLILPSAIVTSLAVAQLSGVVDPAIEFIQSGKIYKLLGNFNVDLQNYLQRIEQSFHLSINLSGALANTIKQAAFLAYQFSPSVLGQTVSFIAQAFLMLVVVFFLFVEGRSLYQEFVLLSPLKDAHEHALAKEIKTMIHAVLYGFFMTAMVQGLLAAGIFYFLSIKGFIVLGILTFFFSFIPIIGAAGIWVPATLVLFLLGETKSALVLLGYGALIISSVDNFLKPYFMGSGNHVHPALLFLSIMGGVALVGPLGILLGPIAIAVFLAALKIYKQDYLVNS